jgi:hypothetical protein
MIMAIWFKTMKAKMLFYTMLIKNRMGISTQPEMGFDLSRLVTIIVDLNDLIAPILHDKMDRIIKLLPDKAPSPDGFNGLFVKK